MRSKQDSTGPLNLEKMYIILLHIVETLFNMLNIIKIYIKSVKTPKKSLDPDNCTPKIT
jgi:hypothetical protein